MSTNPITRGRYKGYFLFGAKKGAKKIRLSTRQRWWEKNVNYLPSPSTTPPTHPVNPILQNNSCSDEPRTLSLENTVSASSTVQDEANVHDEAKKVPFDLKLNSGVTTDDSPRLFLGSKISERESCLLLLAFCMRYQISDSGLGDLLNLINFHMPDGATVPPSVYLLQKTYGADYTCITKHWYCKSKNCLRMLDDDEIKQNSCKVCKQNPVENESYFVTFEIRKLLESLLGRPEISQAVSGVLKKRESGQVGVWEDIWDGDMYKALKLKNSDLTFCLNTDGISPFKKAKFQVWPILLSLNELPFNLRRKNTIVAGLWFGKNKPKFNLFLKPFVSQASALARIPLKWQNGNSWVESKVYFPFCAADSPARCMVQYVNQFNGAHSCNWCELKGGRLVFLNGEWKLYVNCDKTQVTRKTKKKRVFDPSENAPMRDKNRHISQASEFGSRVKTEPMLKHVVGVKGASQLLLLPKFCIAGGFVFDYMHTTLLGVLCSITTMLIESANYREPYYLGRSKELISKRIRQFKSPSECSRHLRDLDDIVYWKANEWKQWFLICIPVLRGILKEPYLGHLVKFIHGFTLLLQSRVLEKDLVEADTLITEFTQSVPELYGIQFCTFNLHILTHATKCVRDWGPLWCYSLFQFEGFNGILTNCFHGTAKIGAQIARKYIRAQQVFALGDVAISNPFARSFWASLLTGKKYYLQSLKCGECTFLGPSRPYIFSEAERDRLSALGLEVSEAQSYKRCVIRGRVYTAHDTKFCSNNIVRVGERFYIVRALLGNKEYQAGILLCNYIQVQKDKLMNNWKVINISVIPRFVQTDNIDTCKFIAQFQGNKLVFFTPLICTEENE